MLAYSQGSGALEVNRCYKALLTRVVHTSLDDIIHSEASGGLLVPQLSIYLLGQCLGHVVVVLGKVRILPLNWEVHLEVVVGVSERHDCVSDTVGGN